MAETPPPQAFDSWAILELMGHLRRAGRVREVELAGAKVLRIDIPTEAPDVEVTEFFGGGAIYRLRPCSEEVARAAAVQIGDPRPVRPVEYREHGPVQPQLPSYADEDEPAF